MIAPALTKGLDWKRENLRRFSDTIRLRSGRSITIRFVDPQDGKALQGYFSTLSSRARYNRFTGASNGLSNSELEQLLNIGERNRFAVLAEMTIEGHRTIVGEARYMFDEASGSVEFGLSVDDSFQGQGIGFALLSNLECRAAAFGAHRLYGDTLRTNKEMQALARKAGFAFTSTPGDWHELRVVKTVPADAEHPVCAQWEVIAAGRAKSELNWVPG